MTSPELQSFWYVALNLKNIRTGAVVTYNFGSWATYVDLSNYYPLLENIGSLSYAMSGYIPQDRSSTVTLSNEPNSFGAERRLSDLFQELSPVEQEIVIYWKKTTLDDTNLSTGTTRVYRAIVKNWTTTDGKLTLSIQSGLIPKGIAGAPVPNTLASVSSKAVGKSYPLIVGQAVEAPATLFEDSSTQPAFAFSSHMKGFEPNSAGALVYAKNSRNEYSRIQNASTSAITYGNPGARTNTNPISLDSQRWIRRVVTGSEGAVISAVWLNVRSLGSGARTSRISCQVWKSDELLAYDPSGRTKVGILTGTITTAAINEDKDGYLFTESPIVLEPNSYYYFDFDTKDATSAHFWNSINTTPENILIAETGSGDAAPWTFTTSGYTDRWGVFCCGWAIGSYTSVNDRGYSWSYVRISRDTVSGTITDFRKLAIAGKFNGMTDDGTLGLSAGTLITSAKSAIDLLCRDWNGSAWTNSTLDTSVFTDCQPGVRQNAADPYNRSIGGYLGANTTVSQLLDLLCRSSACRLAPINSASAGKYLALVAWGNTQAVSGVFTDENSKIIRCFQNGSDTVVNDVTIVYGKSAIDQRFEESLLEGRTRGYNYVTRYNKDTNLRSNYLCSESQAVYGARDNAVQAFDFLNDQPSALIVAESLAAIYAQAHQFVELETTTDFLSVMQCLKIFEVLSTELPSMYGTSAEARLPTYDGTPVDLLQGHYWKRAARYRSQAEEYTIQPNLGGFPVLRVILRLLTNFGEDLT